ncbi:MarR family winged helix-turn-helix transcriptional regulator [Streptomyces pactum]|uniref:MarR family winged helix-turn-helix transcriptional regulator n=1 Tax=Streptomyces pactum TaxID=68249 RepID=UPI001E627758|nr:MarR family transcriptional regulator [Streptomyces pactum]
MPELSPSQPSAKEPPERTAVAVAGAPHAVEGTPGPPPVTDDPAVTDAVAVDLLRSAVMRLGRRLKHQRVDESLSPTEMSVLGTLARCGSATPGELARKEHVQPPSMTRIVALLESKGLVRLDPHPEDRRQKVVSQTEQAEAMLEESRRKRNAWLAELAGRLDEEERAALRVAAPVLEKLANL